ncbi:MAG: hypothetical protein KJ896_01575, partial [Nanoarchaeota archaeon]|nr:hypothetical protein [Nanoarchaeota archaeon]
MNKLENLQEGNTVTLEDITNSNSDIDFKKPIESLQEKFPDQFQALFAQIGMYQNIFAEIMDTKITEVSCEKISVQGEDHLFALAKYENGVFYGVPVNEKTGEIVDIKPFKFETNQDGELVNKGVEVDLPHNFVIPYADPNYWQAPVFLRSKEKVSLGTDTEKRSRATKTDIKYSIFGDLEGYISSLRVGVSTTEEKIRYFSGGFETVESCRAEFSWMYQPSNRFGE